LKATAGSTHAGAAATTFYGFSLSRAMVSNTHSQPAAATTQHHYNISFHARLLSPQKYFPCSFYYFQPQRQKQQQQENKIHAE
jgi:hypothetical protein